MSFRSKFLVLGISSAIALYVFVGGILSPWAIRAQQPINDEGAQLRIFQSVLQHIQNDYVDTPNLDKVRGGAMRGLANGLDPYSSYLTADQVKDFNAKKQNTLAGIGVVASQASSYLLLSVIKDSPADKAGLKTGDVVEYIDNKATHDLSLYDAKQLLYGDPGTKINLRIWRSGAKPQTITVTRGTYKTPIAEGRMESGKIGVVKVYSLDEGENLDIKNRVAELQKQGADKIVLDLRGVASGNLQEGADVANIFIKDGTLAEVIGKESKVTQTFTADPKKAIFDGKVAVLIDLTTSGAAEAVAGAIRDRTRGEVIGERSFGFGVEQQLFTMHGGDGFLLTTARWASPTGTTFLADERTNSGIKPTIEVKKPDTPDPIEVDNLIDQQEQEKENPQPQASPSPTAKPETPKPAAEDLQLKKAIEVLNGQQVMKAAAGQ